MRKYYIFLCIIFSSLFITSCSGGDSPIEDEKDDNTSETDNSYPIMLWVDASANFSKFITRDGVISYLNKAKEAGFTDIIVDVRPTSGEVLYKGSKLAPEIVEWKGVKRDTSWDYLECFVTQGHKLGLKIHAAMNTLTAGQNIMKRGPVYTDDKIASWTSLLSTQTGLLDGKDDNRGAVFLNPSLPEVKQYVIGIAREIVSGYDIDGIILDRCRFDNEDADWNDTSKAAFEQYVKSNYGREGIKFPKDIYEYNDLGKKVYGIYRNVWYEWRASVIRNLFYSIRDEIKKIKPSVKFSTYTGGWYSSYYEEGSNWASETYDPSSEFPEWANSRYKNTGFAEALDMHLAGFYYSAIEGTGWWTIAGGIENVKRVNKGACKVIASLAPEKFINNTEGLKNAIKVSKQNAAGIMIFDLYHVEENNFWSTIKSALQ